MEYLNNISFTQNPNALALNLNDLSTDWTPYLDVAVDQNENGVCGNCWAHSFIEPINAVLNKYMPEESKKLYANSKGLVILSYDMLTHCTNFKFNYGLSDQVKKQFGITKDVL